MGVNSELIEKWTKVGVLDDVPEIHIDMVVGLYEQLLFHIMRETKYNDVGASCSIPILRKVLDKTNYKEIDVKHLMLFISEMIISDEVTGWIKKYSEYSHIEAEAGVINIISKEYVIKITIK